MNKKDNGLIAIGLINNNLFIEAKKLLENKQNGVKNFVSNYEVVNLALKEFIEKRKGK